MSKKEILTGLVIGLFVAIIVAFSFTYISVMDMKNSESDFNVSIEYEDFKVVDTTYLWSDSTTFETFTIKQGYVVSVGKHYREYTNVKSSYYKEVFVENKKDIPSVVCELKSQILKEREQDKKISKEIEKIKASINCDDS